MELTLAAVLREESGKGIVTKLRQKGQLPGVIYGEGQAAEMLTVDAHDFGRLIQRSGTGKLISLKIQAGKGQKEEHVLIKEYQRHPVKGNPIHVDFLRVAMDHVVTVKVPVHLVNEEKRTRDGAVLEILAHEVEVSCLPSVIPDRIGIDVSKLAMGSGIHVKDLQLPEGVKVLAAPEEMLVLAAAPVTATETTGTEASEPEVVGEKKAGE